MKKLILTAVAALAMTSGAALAANSWSSSSNQVSGNAGWISTPFSNSFAWGGTETYGHSAQSESNGTVNIGPFPVPVVSGAAAQSYSTWSVDGMAGTNGFGGGFGFQSTGASGGGAATAAGN